jgi:uncharacterized tellurite resistance protein B-like protein
MEEQLRKKICRLVAGIVVADDDLDEKEDAFLDRLLVTFGIPADQRDELFPIVDRAEAASEIKTLPKEVQNDVFNRLVDAACADGKVVPEEREYLKAVASAIGVSEDDVDARLVDALEKA